MSVRGENIGLIMSFLGMCTPCVCPVDFKIPKNTLAQWPTFVIPVTEATEAGIVKVRGQPGQFNETLSQNKIKRAGDVENTCLACRKFWFQLLVLSKFKNPRIPRDTLALF